MASTYSPSLRLELMATGDQSGTWGVTTNGNLGTLLEQAITGVLSVAEGDTTLTLTTVNGGSDQARNAVINLTGAMTASRNVIVQTAQKLYLIKNSTTGGFSIVAKTAAGTGVTIAAGTSQWVYSDGTNVVAGLLGNGAPDVNGNIAANNFLPGYTTTATAAGTTTLTVASTYSQYFTGSTTQTITLPVTSTLVLGQQFEIVNESTGSLTVNSSGGNLVATVTAGSTTRVQVILVTGTSATSWQVIASSVPNPLTLSGSSVGYTPLVLTSTEAAAAAGPIENLFRDSASPAANDILAQLLFNGRDSAANIQEYASIQSTIVSPTSTSEASTLDFYTFKGGARTLGLSLAGAVANSPNHVNGYTTTATAAGTTTLTVSSNHDQYFTGTTTQTVVLPVATTLVNGQEFVIHNNSTGRVTVNTSGGTTLQVMGGTLITFAPGAPGTILICRCINTAGGTGAASWDFEYLAPTTNWVSYTPVFTGFGTCTGIFGESRRVGDSVQHKITFTSGTTTAVEARITYGFNGTSGNITADSVKVPSLQLTGDYALGANGAYTVYCLAEPSVSYATFSLQQSGGSGMTKVTGSTIGVGNYLQSLIFEVPITNG